MYQKINLKDLKINPFEEIGNNWVLITAKDPQGKVNTMTASWGNMGVLWNLPVVTCYIRPQRYTKEFVDSQDYFTITLFTGHKKELGILGTKSGRDGDKIKEAGFDLVEVAGQPTFEQGKLVFVCKKIYTDLIKPERFLKDDIDSRYYPDHDYHTLYMGEIVGVYENK